MALVTVSVGATAAVSLLAARSVAHCVVVHGMSVAPFAGTVGIGAVALSVTVSVPSEARLTTVVTWTRPDVSDVSASWGTVLGDTGDEALLSSLQPIDVRIRLLIQKPRATIRKLKITESILQKIRTGRRNSQHSEIGHFL